LRTRERERERDQGCKSRRSKRPYDCCLVPGDASECEIGRAASFINETKISFVAGGRAVGIIIDSNDVVVSRECGSVIHLCAAAVCRRSSPGLDDPYRSILPYVASRRLSNIIEQYGLWSERYVYVRVQGKARGFIFGEGPMGGIFESGRGLIGRGLPRNTFGTQRLNL